MRSMIGMRNQTGAALLVSLIILLILSIIGISAMRGGLLQLLIAANSQQAEMAFSVADAGVSAVVYNANAQGIAADGILAQATVAAGQATTYGVDAEGEVAAVEDDAPYFDDDGERTTPISSVTADVAWEGCNSICPGFSMKVGDPNKPGCHAFQINASSTVADAEAQVDQWVNAVGAACAE